MECLKSRKDGELLEVYRKIHKLLVLRGLKPKIYFLDNECAESFKSFMYMNDEKLQLFPPNIHRKNVAVQAIQNFKSHFIAGLISVNKIFSFYLWRQMVPHVIITVNLL